MSRPSVPVVLRTGRPRRRDAERNRARILDVARGLVHDRGIAAVTMDAVAGAAGVGKGTLYRAFGSRAGVAEALLDEAERELQERILSGPPPLGWGAPPSRRLRAFVSAYVEFLSSNVDLLVETERGAPGARFHTGAYALWHAHVAGLLRQEGRTDPDVLAHAVLALLAAELHQHLRAQRVDPARVEGVILELLDVNAR